VAAPAYETLLLDVMIGEMTLFTRSDEVEAAWQLIDPLLEFWDKNPASPMPTYEAGGWGPGEADALIGRLNGGWRRPCVGELDRGLVGRFGSEATNQLANSPTHRPYLAFGFAFRGSSAAFT
jgi:hypothetical protein